MKKYILLLLALLLCGCQTQSQPTGAAAKVPQLKTVQHVTPAEPEPEPAAQTPAVLRGPFGELTVLLPDGWSNAPCPDGGCVYSSGGYGMHLYPTQAAEGFIEICYPDTPFGVCGTGLETEEVILADSSACIGTYDGHPYWDYVVFNDGNQGVVALTCQVERWWPDYGDQALAILDTLQLEKPTAAS